jgi:putative transposase
MSVEEKRRCIEPQPSQLSVSRQCELIGLPRASYYRSWVFQPESEENLKLRRLILTTYQF